MFRITTLAAAFALAFGAASLAEDKKVTSIHDVMEKAHDEDAGLKAKVEAAVKAKKLADAKKPSEEWVKLAADLGKNKPPKGSEAEWKKRTTTLLNAAKDVLNDKPGANKALAAAGNCKACHQAHKAD